MLAKILAILVILIAAPMTAAAHSPAESPAENPMHSLIESLTESPADNSMDSLIESLTKGPADNSMDSLIETLTKDPAERSANDTGNYVSGAEFIWRSCRGISRFNDGDSNAALNACWGYLAGIYQGQYVVGWAILAQEPWFCPPRGFDQKQYAEDVIEFMTARPETRTNEFNAAEVAVAAARAKYPCRESWGLPPMTAE